MSEYETFIKKSQSTGRKMIPRYTPRINFPKLKIADIFIDKNRYMSSDEFLRNGYLTMEMLISHGYLRFSQIVFDMLWSDLRQKNIEPLEIKEPSIFDSAYVRIEDGKIPYSLSTDSSGYFYHMTEKGQSFIEKFIHSVKNSFMFALDIVINFRNVDAHQNLCLFYKKGNNIHLFLYEPHGSGAINNTVFRFINFLKMTLRNEDLNVIHEWDDQIYYNPVGNQVIGEDREGYCVMYTFFWLYLVLKSVLETGSTDHIKDMETIISYNFKGKDLHDIIKNFSQKFFNYYFSTVRVVDFERRFIESLQGTNVNYTIHTTKRVKPSDYWTVEEKKVDEIEPEDSFAELFRFKDGKPCGHDSECLSDNCEEGICKPYNYYKPGPLPAAEDGEYCERDCDCVSKYCEKESNLCRPRPEYEILEEEQPDYKILEGGDLSDEKSNLRTREDYTNEEEWDEEEWDEEEWDEEEWDEEEWDEEE